MQLLELEVPHSLAADLDEMVAAGKFQTRHDAVVGAIALLVATQTSHDTDLDVVRSYRGQPQTDEEVAAARAAGTALIEAEPW